MPQKFPEIMKYDGVFEGGGVKIPALVGAIKGIESFGFEPSSLAGTSAGSIAASLRIAGYKPAELEQIVLDMDFRKFKDGGMWGTGIYHLIRDKGLYKGDLFYNTIRDYLAEKNIYTFADLVRDNPDPKFRYSLRVFTADITNGLLIKFPDDAVLYDKNPNDMEVAWAVRCSMSIPLFFYPMKLKYFIKDEHGVPQEKESKFVDGALLSNFPISVFDAMKKPSWPTFGVRFESVEDTRPFPTSGPLQYLEALMKTMMLAHDKQHIHSDDYKYRTIKAPVGTTGATDFDIPNHKKIELIENGYKAAREFLENWSFEEYSSWAVNIRNAALK